MIQNYFRKLELAKEAENANLESLTTQLRQLEEAIQEQSVSQ